MEFVGCTAPVGGVRGGGWVRRFNFAIAIAYSRVLYRMGSFVFFSFLVDQVEAEPDVVLHLILERVSGRFGYHAQAVSLVSEKLLHLGVM